MSPTALCLLRASYSRLLCRSKASHGSCRPPETACENIYEFNSSDSGAHQKRVSSARIFRNAFTRWIRNVDLHILANSMTHQERPNAPFAFTALVVHHVSRSLCWPLSDQAAFANLAGFTVLTAFTVLVASNAVNDSSSLDRPSPQYASSPGCNWLDKLCVHHL